MLTPGYVTEFKKRLDEFASATDEELQEASDQLEQLFYEEILEAIDNLTEKLSVLRSDDKVV